MAAMSVVIFVAGCATTPNGKAYQTLKDTQTLVDNAMRYYGTQCALGKVSTENQAQIDEAHFKYRSAFRSAVNLARLDYSKLTPDDVQLLANEILTLISKL